MKTLADWSRRLGRAAVFSLGGLTLAAVIALLLSMDVLPSRYDFHQGDVSPYHIKSPSKVSYISRIATQQEKDRAAARVGEVYSYDPSISKTQRAKVLDLLGKIQSIRQSLGTQDQKRLAIESLLPKVLTSEQAIQLLQIDDDSWRKVAAELPRTLDQSMTGRIEPADLAQVKLGLDQRLADSLPETVRPLAAGLLEPFIVPSVVVNTEATVEAKRKAAEAVEPVRVQVEKGETILRDGDVVGPFDLEKLEAVGLRNPNISWQEVLANGLIAILFTAILMFFLSISPQHTIGPYRRLFLVGSIVVVTILGAKLLIPGREVFAYIFPIAGVGMLLTTLVEVQTGIVVVMLLSPILGHIASDSLQFTAVSLIGGLVGCLGVRQVRSLFSYFLTGIWVSLANLAVIGALQTLAHTLDPQQMAMFAAVSLANGPLSSALAIGAASILGSIFGVITDIGLLELAHPNQPLFRHLLTAAPGTYHHSLMVANLSERAAHDIGASALLARVGAYYHDIGKTAQPYFFIENQQHGENIHSTMDPASSAKAIAQHIKDGLDLARRHHLPERVAAIIPQHHGTRVMKYFYNTACNAANDGQVDAELFRYPGPRPQSREAAVVMLADAVEAIVRGSADHSPERISYLVDVTVDDIVNEEQLDESNITIGDLKRIKKAFVEVLQGLFHPRIEYPERILSTADAAPPVSEASDLNG